MSMHISEHTLLGWMRQTKMPEYSSIKPLLLNFAMGGSSSSEIGCLNLVMLLAGYPVPLRLATNGFDMHRMAWFIRSMMEHADDQWPGFTKAELEPVWQRHPDLHARVQAAAAVWRD